MLVPAMTEWLTPKGLEHLRKIRDTNDGRLNVVLTVQGFPHPVHFREGMQIRNKMRELMKVPEGILPEHFYDDNWEQMVHLCLEAADG